MAVILGNATMTHCMLVTQTQHACYSTLIQIVRKTKIQDDRYLCPCRYLYQFIIMIEYAYQCHYCSQHDRGGSSDSWQ